MKSAIANGIKVIYLRRDIFQSRNNYVAQLYLPRKALKQWESPRFNLVFIVSSICSQQRYIASGLDLIIDTLHVHYLSR